MKRVFFLLALAFLSTKMFSQNEKFIGLTLITEKYENPINVGVGAFYEYKFWKNIGTEIGLNFRTRTEKTTFLDPLHLNEIVTTSTNVSFLSMPVVVKCYTKIVNISAGLNFDYFVGWKDVSNMENLVLTNYSITPKFFVGYAFKIGKSIKLSPRIFIEPEISYNPLITFNGQYLSASLKIKYLTGILN